MSGSGEVPDEPDWARIRADYEHGVQKVAEIAAAAGMSASALTLKARREAWTLRGKAKASASDTGDTIARLKKLLQQRLGELESQIGTLGEAASAATSERDIRAMNTLVRTLEKVLELEREERARRQRSRIHNRRHTDAERETLARKLEGLRREFTAGAETAPPAEPPGSDAAEPGLAPVGP